MSMLNVKERITRAAHRQAIQAVLTHRLLEGSSSSCPALRRRCLGLGGVIEICCLPSSDLLARVAGLIVLLSLSDLEVSDKEEDIMAHPPPPIPLIILMWLLVCWRA